MPHPLYRLSPTTDLPRPLAGPGPVLAFPKGGFARSAQNALIFACPCGAREVYVTCPPHDAVVNADGLVTIVGSLGGAGKWKAAATRCHFTVTEGVAAMCDDAACPGAQPAE